MPFPLIAALATVGSSLIGGLATSQAAKAQQQGIDTATGEQRREYDISRGLLQPAITAGDTARNYQLGGLGLPGGASYDEATNAFRTSPGYDFARRSGIDAAQSSAAAGGTLFSGRTLKDLTRFGTGIADQEYGNYYNRLAGISGSGQAATGGLVSAGQNTANNLASLATQGGDARASSYIRGANNIIGGAQNLADLAAYGGYGSGYRPSLPGRVPANPFGFS